MAKRRDRTDVEWRLRRTLKICVLVATCVWMTESAEVGISAMFGPQTSFQDNYQTIIQDGVRYVNRNTTFLSQAHHLEFIVAPNNRPSNSVYVAQQEICDHVATSQVSALILPRDRCTASYDIAGVVSKVTNPVFSIDQGSLGSGSIAFKMQPSPEDMTSFFIDILTYYKWIKFTLLYDDGGALQNMEGVMQYAIMHRWKISTVIIDQDFRNNIKMIEKPGSSSNIFIYCTSETVLRSTIDQALQFGFMGPTYTWMIGNMDMAIDRQFLEDSEDSNASVIRFNMNFTREIQYALPTARNTPTLEWRFRDRCTFDAVIAVVHGLRLYRLERTRQGAIGSSVLPGNTSMPACPTSSQVLTENELTQYLKQIQFEGITGNVAFDDDGNRVNYTITIRSGKGEFIDQIRGDWTQNIQYWEDRWDRKWESDTRLSITAYEYSNDRKIEMSTVSNSVTKSKKVKDPFNRADVSCLSSHNYGLIFCLLLCCYYAVMWNTCVYP